MTDVANLQVSIGVDTSQLEAGFGRANAQVDGFSTKVGGLGSALGTLATSAAVAGVAAIGAGFAGAITTATGFEKQISAISAVAGSGAASIDQLRTVALQLGKDTSFSASEAAAGMEEMVKAGMSMADVLGGGARAALDLAAAGGLSVAEAATVASNAMNAFGLAGSDMAHIADTLAGASVASATDVHQLGFALAAVGAVAHTIGLSFDDTTTAISLMAQAGLKGSDAGTSLKTMLLNLSPSTKKAKEEMMALGIITADGANQFFDAEGKVKSFRDISEVLKTSLAGLTKEQQINALKTMFGTDAIRAAAIAAEMGAEGYDKMAIAEAAAGGAQAVANERLNNFSGSLEKFKGSVETAAIMIGSLFLPAMKGMVDSLTEGVNTAIDVIQQLPDAWTTIQQVLAGDWSADASIHPFTNAVGELAITFRDQLLPSIQPVIAFVRDSLVPAFQAAAQFMAQHTEIIIGIVAAFATFQTISFVTALVAGIGAAIAALASPIVLVGAAIAVLVAAWVGNWGGIRDITLAAWAAIEPTFAAIVDWLGQQIPLALNWITTVGWPALVAAGQAVSTWITETAIPAITALADWLGPKIAAVITWISETGWPALVIAGTAVSEWISTVAIPAFTALVDWLGPKITAVLTWVTETGWPALVTAGQAVSEWVTGTAIPALTQLVDWLGPKISAVTTWISETGWPALVTAGTAVGTMIQSVIKFFQDLYVELEKRGVFTELGTIWNTLTTTGNLVWAMIQTLVDWLTKLNTAMTPVKEAVAALVAAAMLPTLATHFQTVGTNAKLAISPVELIAAAIQGVVDQVTRGLAPLTNFLAAMRALSEIKMPSFPSFGGGGGSGGGGASSVPGASMPSGGGGPGGANIQAIVPGGRGGMSQGGTHQGGPAADVMAPMGTPIYSPVGGTIVSANNSLGGNAVILHGDDGNYYYMAHGAVPFRTGRVGTGDLIGQVGNTGNASGGPPHLHLAVADNPGVFDRTGGQGNISLPQTGPPTRPATAPAGAGAGGDFPALQGAEKLQVAWEPGGLLDPAAWGERTRPIIDLMTQMATAVVAQSMSMANGALTHVTALGTGYSTITQGLSGATISTFTDMAGNVTNQQVTMANGVTTTLAAMAAAGQVTTQNMGTVIVTTMTDMAGNVTTTTTDLAGHVIDQALVMATGVTANAATMATGVTTNAATMAEGQTSIMGAMVDAAIANGTTMSTEVVSQTGLMAEQAILNGTTMSTEVVSQTGLMAENAILNGTTMNTGFTEQVADMTTRSLVSVTDLGDGTKLTITQMGTDATAIITDMSGNIIQVIDVTATETIERLKTMSTDGSSSVEEMATEIGKQVAEVSEAFKKTASPIEDFQGALDSVKAPDFSDIVDSLGEVEDAAKSAAKAVKSVGKGSDFDDEGKGGHKGGGKAAGGPVAAGTTYWVGERGPELFTSRTSGLIVPNDALRGGGGDTIVVNINLNGANLSTSREMEDAVVAGIEMARARGRVS